MAVSSSTQNQGTRRAVQIPLVQQIEERFRHFRRWDATPFGPTERIVWLQAELRIAPDDVGHPVATLQYGRAGVPRAASVPSLDARRVKQLLPLPFARHRQRQQTHVGARYLQRANQSGAELHGALDPLTIGRPRVEMLRPQND